MSEQLYFTRFSNWEKHILTQKGWTEANKPESVSLRPIDAYQVRNFTVCEFQRIMEMPFKKAIDVYFPNI